MQNSIEDHDLLSLKEDLPMSGKDQAVQQRFFSGTILRGLTQLLNAFGYKYFSLLLLLFYPFVVPADLSQQAKSATALLDSLTYSDSIGFVIQILFQSS
jgi:hypothetical protein